MKTHMLPLLPVTGLMLRAWLAVACCVSTVACTASFSSENLGDAERRQTDTETDIPSQRDVLVCVGVPLPGRDKNHPYPSSGNAVGFEVRRQALKCFAGAPLLQSGLALDQAVAAAKQKACEFLLFSEIIRWEDRLTEWSGDPDAVELRIQAIRVSDAVVVDDRLISGQGPSFTFGGHPEDLLERPLSQHVSQLDLRSKRAPSTAGPAAQQVKR